MGIELKGSLEPGGLNVERVRMLLNGDRRPFRPCSQCNCGLQASGPYRAVLPLSLLHAGVEVLLFGERWRQLAAKNTVLVHWRFLTGWFSGYTMPP